MTNDIKGIDGCSSVWCNSSSHTAIYRDYTPARKARADPQHSKWSTHNWTPLLNDLENSLALHWREREHERKTEIQQEWKKESIWDTEALSSHNMFIIDLKMWVFSIPGYLKSSIRCGSSNKRGTDMSVLPCVPACKSSFTVTHC